MKRHVTSALVLPLSIAAACREIPTSDRVETVASPRFNTTVASECGGQTDLRDSRIRLEWASLAELNATSGITSDGGGAYTGGAQGVHGKLFYHDAGCARSGDVVFDPDKSSFKPARKLTFRFPSNSIGLSTSGVRSGAYMTISALMQLSSDVTWDAAFPVGRDAKIDAKYPGIARGLEYPDSAGVRPGYPTTNLVTPKFRIQYTGIAGCEALEYDAIRAVRTSGAVSFTQLDGQRSGYDSAPLGEWAATRDGAWRVESLPDVSGDHRAQCYATRKGSLAANGTKMNMPFKVIIAELPGT